MNNLYYKCVRNLFSYPFLINYNLEISITRVIYTKSMKFCWNTHCEMPKVYLYSTKENKEIKIMLIDSKINEPYLPLDWTTKKTYCW